MKYAMIVGLAALCLAAPASMSSAEAADDRHVDPHGAESRSVDGWYQVRDNDTDDESEVDQDRARELVEDGVIHPLPAIIGRAKGLVPGEVVGFTFARKAGRWVYSVKVLTPPGKRVEITIDAGTLAILPARPR